MVFPSVFVTSLFISCQLVFFCKNAPLLFEKNAKKKGGRSIKVSYLPVNFMFFQVGRSFFLKFLFFHIRGEAVWLNYLVIFRIDGLKKKRLAF